MNRRYSFASALLASILSMGLAGSANADSGLESAFVPAPRPIEMAAIAVTADTVTSDDQAVVAVIEFVHSEPERLLRLAELVCTGAAAQASLIQWKNTSSDHEEALQLVASQGTIGPLIETIQALDNEAAVENGETPSMAQATFFKLDLTGEGKREPLETGVGKSLPPVEVAESTPAQFDENPAFGPVELASVIIFR